MVCATRSVFLYALVDRVQHIVHIIPHSILPPKMAAKMTERFFWLVHGEFYSGKVESMLLVVLSTVVLTSASHVINYLHVCFAVKVSMSSIFKKFINSRCVYLSWMSRIVNRAARAADSAENNVIQMGSVLKKRRRKMNRHKYKKLTKKMRSLTRKLKKWSIWCGNRANQMAMHLNVHVKNTCRDIKWFELHCSCVEILFLRCVISFSVFFVALGLFG